MNNDAGEKVIVDRPYVVAVEGKTDKRFFDWMAGKLDLSHGILVWQYDGVSNLKPKIKALTKTEGFRMVAALGVVMDADDHPDRQYQRICGALCEAGLSLSRDKLVPVEEGPMLFMLILPGKNEQGAIEAVCLKSVQGDPLMPCVERFSRCVEEEWGASPEARLGKMRLQAFLATREDDPELRLGEAAEKGVWPFDHPAFDEIRAFLKNLCEVS